MTDQNERIEIIRDAARTAYENIDKCGYAITSFEPGDGTRYVVIIGVDPDGYDWWVSLGGYGGRTYRWHPDNSTFTDKEYCGHWTSNQQARGVLSTFLNALRDAYNLAPAHDPDPAPTDDHKEPPRTMRIEITPFGSIETVTVTPGVGHTVIRDCFNGVTLETDDGERLSICMRDSGFEALYSVNNDSDNDSDNDEALSLSLQNGKIQFDTGARP